ncbi:hypothetical protein [Cellulomonas gilvus]|uniref:Uncharacterized protein n=1 Tax=Cellulomonas gilvus (strain ATCC 13127 / NRRL B-14078) TaxID=593907 RepID=F8A020_CELGA|nr:hypothetical protein [Cellulomonas gilvus]AEI11439.1 hypothetical protein Celgi_0920 [Cellulomonas gilvus ATCC 13127]
MSSTFTPTLHQAAVDELRGTVSALSDRLHEVRSALDSAVSRWGVPGWLADGLAWCTERMLDLGRTVLTRTGELLEGAAAPVRFFLRAYDWSTQVGAPASAVASAVHPNALRAPLSWTGDAATTYKAAVAGQAAAASQVQSISSAVTVSLGACAVAGLAFYVALGVIVAKFLAAATAAVVALGSVVLSWAGLLLIVEEAAVNLGMITAAVATLVATQGAAAAALVNITNASGAHNGFPGGHWPRGTA